MPCNNDASYGRKDPIDMKKKGTRKVSVRVLGDKYHLCMYTRPE